MEAVGVGQQGGNGIGFVGGLVKNVDLGFRDREGFVLPTDGNGAAEGIEAVRFGFGRANMDVDRA